MAHRVRSSKRARRIGSGRSALRRRVASAALLMALGSFSVDTRAQEDAQSVSARDVSKANQDLARSVAVTGREAFNAGDYETALALFRRAYALFPAPTVVLYEARSLERMGRLIEAVEAYERTTETPVDASAPARFAEAIAAAHQEGRDLRARIPTLTLQVRGVSGHDPNLEIQINGKAIGTAQIGHALNLDPGTYAVSAWVSPERRDQKQAVLVAGNKTTVLLDLSDAPPDVPAPHQNPLTQDARSAPGQTFSPFMYVAGAVGVAGIGAGVVTGIMANGKHTEAEDECPNQECVSGSTGPQKVNDFRKLRTVSTFSYGVGAAGLAVGVVLWLTADTSPSTNEAATLEPYLTPETAGIRGIF